MHQMLHCSCLIYPWKPNAVQLNTHPEQIYTKQDTYCWPSSLSDVHLWLDEKMDEERTRYRHADIFYLVGEKSCGGHIGFFEERCHPAGSCVNGCVGKPGMNI